MAPMQPCFVFGLQEGQKGSPGSKIVVNLEPAGLETLYTPRPLANCRLACRESPVARQETPDPLTGYKSIRLSLSNPSSPRRTNMPAAVAFPPPPSMKPGIN